MTPKFYKGSFSFEEGEPVPEHIDEFPFDRSERKPDKWHLDGYDTFDGEFYPLAINLDSEFIAQSLVRARLRLLEETQPSSSSGGQSGIQDKVYIRPPRR